MKTLTAKIGIFMIFLSNILFFTSCDNRYYYQRSSLDLPPVIINSDRWGDFSFSRNFHVEDFANIDPFYDDIRSLTLENSELQVYSDRYLRANDIVSLTLKSSNGRSIDIQLIVDNYGFAFIDSYDSVYNRFMLNLMNSILKNGIVSLTISGHLEDYRGQAIANVPFEFYIRNDIEFKIRE